MSKPKPIPLTAPRIEIDASKIGFTLKADDETIEALEQMREERAVTALNRKPLLFR